MGGVDRRTGAAFAWALTVLVGCGEAPADLPPEAVDEAALPRVSVPREQPNSGYLGSDSCADCHPANHRTWHASYHRRMTQAASPEAVLAPFEGRTPVLEGAAWSLEEVDGEFFATPGSATGDRQGERMRVAMTTGSHHYQVYWLESHELGELLMLPFVWHLGEGSWQPRRSQFMVPPHESFEFELGRWGDVCILCHATHGVPDPIGADGPVASEFGISCEACHGPGANHVRRERALEAGEDSPVPERLAGMVDPSDLDHRRSAMVCGQCHSVHPVRSVAERDAWRRGGFSYRPGEDLGKTRELLKGIPERNSRQLLAAVSENPGTFDELFWRDGEIRVSGREYNGLVESACYVRGKMDCLSCHDMHPGASDPRPLPEWANDQLAPGMGGDDACLGCHAEYGEASARTAHTGHGPDSTGSECMNCHMPYTTYGLTKAIRSHTISSPNASVTLGSGRPNACNLCHLDRSLGWAAEELASRYGQRRPALDELRERRAASVVGILSGDAGERALWAQALGWAPAREVSGTGWMPYLLSTLLRDPYDAVAQVALKTARLDPRYAELQLDFALPYMQRGEPVRDTVLADWLRAGLSAPEGRGPAVLVGDDGELLEEEVQRLLSRRNDRDVILGE